MARKTWTWTGTTTMLIGKSSTTLYYSHLSTLCTSFIDRDMFMHFRGGAVGHTAMRDWDDFLQCEGHGVMDGQVDEEEHERGDRPNDVQIHEEVEFKELTDNDDRSDEESTGDQSEGDDDEVRIVADDGEVLDGDIYEDKGYGTP